MKYNGNEMNLKNIENRMVPKTISLPVWMLEHLEEKAKQAGLPVSTVIRNIIQSDYNLKNGDDRQVFLKKPGPAKNT